jgi:hypothetical protein
MANLLNLSIPVETVLKSTNNNILLWQGLLTAMA